MITCNANVAKNARPYTSASNVALMSAGAT